MGKTYENVEKVKEDVATENYTDVVVRTNNQKSLVFQCKHGRERKSECSGSRPEQHYNFLGCEASITLYKSQKSDASALKITKVKLSHNHQVNEEIQNFDLSEDDKELLMTLRDKRIKNLIQKLSETHGNGNVELIDGFFLEKWTKMVAQSIGLTIVWFWKSDVSVNKKYEECDEII